MMPEQPRAGICLVRAEAQGDQVLISITLNKTHHRSNYSTPEPTRHFVDADKALAVVAEFLATFAPVAAEDPPDYSA